MVFAVERQDTETAAESTVFMVDKNDVVAANARAGHFNHTLYVHYIFPKWFMSQTRNCYLQNMNTSGAVLKQELYKEVLLFIIKKLVTSLLLDINVNIQIGS